MRHEPHPHRPRHRRLPRRPPDRGRDPPARPLCLNLEPPARRAGRSTPPFGPWEDPATNTALVIAIIALVGSIVTAILTTFGAPVVQRRREAETVLQAYREPLVGAAFELQSRLYNILAPERDFVGRYLRSADPERRAVAMRTTLYVFAQYFGWIEIIRREIEFLRFPRTEQTREVARVVREIGETFLTDEYGTGLMIWRVEQRGIGEQMISPLGQRPTCLGYASFLESKVPERLEAVERGLLAMDDGSRERLTAIQHLALQLVRLLDPDHVRYPFELKAA